MTPPAEAHPERLAWMERRQDRQEQKLASHETTLAVHTEQIVQDRKERAEMAAKLDKLTTAIVAAAISVAVSAIVFSFTIYQVFGK